MSESTDLVMIGYHCYLSKKWGDEVSREPMDGRLVVKPKNVIQIWRRDYVDPGWVVERKRGQIRDGAEVYSLTIWVNSANVKPQGLLGRVLLLF